MRWEKKLHKHKFWIHKLIKSMVVLVDIFKIWTWTIICQGTYRRIVVGELFAQAKLRLKIHMKNIWVKLLKWIMNCSKEHRQWSKTSRTRWWMKGGYKRAKELHHQRNKHSLQIIKSINECLIRTVLDIKLTYNSTRQGALVWKIKIRAKTTSAGSHNNLATEEKEKER